MLFRKQLNQSDVSHLKEILISTGFFYDSEVEIVEELALENLEKGEEKSGYIFNIAEENGLPVGFTCYGNIPGTADSFDLYWIVVHQSQRGKGLGKTLFSMALQDISTMKGKNVWIETSSRALYEPTRQFYIKADCELIAELPNYYGPNDNKVVYLKQV